MGQRVQGRFSQSAGKSYTKAEEEQRKRVGKTREWGMEHSSAQPWTLCKGGSR